MINFKAHSFIIYGLLMYFIVFLFGPYKFTIYNYRGLVYFLFAFFLLYLGAWLFDRPLIKKEYQSKVYEVKLSYMSEMFLNVCVLFSFVMFVVYFVDFRINASVTDYSFAAQDYRDLLSVNRSTLSKISEVLMNCGVVSFLITSRVKKTNYKSTKFISLIGLFLPAFAILAVGARSRVITTVGLFIIIHYLTKKEYKRTKIIKKKISKKQKIAIFVILYFLGYFTLMLFSSRGQYDATYQIVRYHGDTTLKTLYMTIFELTDGLVNPIYKALWYYTHSLPAFTWSFEKFFDVPNYWGSFLFFLPGYVLRGIGINFPEYLMIAKQSPISGLYSSYITGYFLDWGITGTLLMSFLTGLVFGRISYRSKEKKISYYILPIVLFMCWVAPIYYFLHMGWENVFFCMIIIYPIAKLFGLGRVEVKR